jgi:anhydro-N-acetylmuramic acid kinase
MLPIAGNGTYPLPDRLNTLYRHIANQISGQLEPDPLKTVLITGGGAFNIFLIENLKESTPCRLIMPGELLIQFKEAVIFAFLGVLKLRNEINCLSTVTGARKDSSSGLVYD